MSTQKGNTSRTRPQKHQNKTKYKNDLHDKSQRVKLMNRLEIGNVCNRCKDIIEWKIKYKKYKPLKNPATCVKCRNKNVLQAYHTLCSDCCKNFNVCPKCQQNKELVALTNDKSVEELSKSSNVQRAIKSLTEGKRRTFYRHISKSFLNLTTEEEILSKIKELSLNSVGECVLDELSDDSREFVTFESNSDGND